MVYKRLIALILAVVMLAAVQLPVLAQETTEKEPFSSQLGALRGEEDADKTEEGSAEDDTLSGEETEALPGDDENTDAGDVIEGDESTDDTLDEEEKTEDEDQSESSEEEKAEEETDEDSEESEETDEETEESEDEENAEEDRESTTEAVILTDFEWEVSNSRFIESSFGDITITESLADTDHGQHCQMMYSYPDGSYFASRRLYIDSMQTEDFVLYSQEFECENITLRYYNTISGVWVERQLDSDSRMPFGMYFITIDDAQELIVNLPQAYIEKSNDAIQAQANQTGDLCIEKTETGWRVAIMAPRVYLKSFVDYFVMYSNSNIINWDASQTKTQWAGCQFGGDNRWCYNGYYYTSPSNYIPTGENYYHRLPAAYIACKFVPIGLEVNSAKYMSIAMLDVMRDLQNDRGYFPTLSGSQWLLTDYNIGPGFYDTRFNTDLVRAFLEAYRYYSIKEFWQVVENYMKFYIPFVIKNHDSVILKDGWPGWLVYDYVGQYGGSKTHTSLNHQVAQIILMEEIYNVTGNVLVRFLEEMMYRGIQGTEKMWYMSNNNLEYAYFNGKAAKGMQDYPYLTYNDLYELRELYSERLGYIPSTIRNLMASKLKWMEANGVTGYYGSYSTAQETEYTGSVVLTN